MKISDEGGVFNEDLLLLWDCEIITFNLDLKFNHNNSAHVHDQWSTVLLSTIRTSLLVNPLAVNLTFVNSVHLCNREYAQSTNLFTVYKLITIAPNRYPSWRATNQVDYVSKL